MARIARVTSPGVLHHVISRFVDRDWYVETDFERSRYLTLLGRALLRSDWRCLAYCLMSNHLHLAMLAGELDLDSWARKANSPFGRWLNEQHGGLGPVFADRPSAHAVPRHREAEVIAYIHNNPVRAGLVASARESSWSSHQAYLGLVARPAWLEVREGLRRAGCEGDPRGFDALVDGSSDATLELPDIDAARIAVHREGPYEVGTPTLSEPFEVPVVCRPFVRPRASAAAVLAAVAARAGVPVLEASRKHARGSVSMVKRVVIHAAVGLGVSISDASAVVNVSRQRGSRVAQTQLSGEERAIVTEVVALLGLAAEQS